MQFSRSAAVLVISLAIVSGCKRPELDSERSERVERDAREERRDDRHETVLVAQTRTVENFSAIELRGAAQLIITVGPAASLNIDASERTLKHVDSHVSGDTLIIDVAKAHRWFGDNGHLKIVVTTPILKSLDSNGAADIEINGLSGGEQTLELAGAHNVKGEGTLDKLTLELSGAGNIDYHNVKIGDARVTVNGAGNVEVDVTQSLRAEVNGVGAVRYSGDPQKVESELHGLGTISRR